MVSVAVLADQLLAPAALPRRLDIPAGGENALQHRIGFRPHLRDRVRIEHAAHEHKPLRAIRLDVDARYLGCASIHRTTGCRKPRSNDRGRLLTESERSEPVAAFDRKGDAGEIAPV